MRRLILKDSNISLIVQKKTTKSNGNWSDYWELPWFLTCVRSIHIWINKSFFSIHLSNPRSFFIFVTSIK